MTKIAIITPYGAEERLDHFAEFLLAQRLIPRGHDVRFYTYRIRSISDYANDRTHKGVTVFRCRSLFGMAPRLVWQILRWRPQVVVLCHIRSSLNFPAYFASRLVGAKFIFQVVGFLHDPYVVADRDNPLESIYTDLRIIHRFPQFLGCVFRQRKLTECWENYTFHYPLYRSDVRVTITPFERDMLKQVTGLDSAVVPWGVRSVDPHAPETMPAPLAGRPFPATFLFYIGQVKKRKGWDTVIEALAILKREGITKELVFVTSSSASEYQEAIDKVHGLGLDDQVWFLFKISNEEKTWLYRRAEATLAPSRYEGFGLTVFESWAEGVPVLGTDIPVYSDFLHDGVTGLVSKKGDPASLARNIQRLSEPGMREKLVEGGRTKVREYTDEKIVDGFLRVIKRLQEPDAS